MTDALPPQPRRARARPSPDRESSVTEDDAVRDFLLRAGFDVDSDADIRRFATLMRFATDRSEAYDRRVARRQDAVVWVLGTLGGIVLTSLGGALMPGAWAWLVGHFK